MKRVLSLMIASLLLAAGPASAAVVDRVVAAVGEQLVTQSELDLEEHLVQRDTPAHSFWSARRAPALQRLIEAALIRELAGDVAVYLPPEVDITERVDRLRAEFESREAWNQFLLRHGLDEDTLRVTVRRRMIVERYVARSISVSPTQTDAFDAAIEALVAGPRARYRIRVIEAESP